jgi:hypothetical protein
MHTSLLYLSVFAVVAVVFTPNARADDAYVCDGGRLVYARPETLEKLKLTDPCIAKYYGNDVKVPPALTSVRAREELHPITPALAPAIQDPPPPRGVARGLQEGRATALRLKEPSNFKPPVTPIAVAPPQAALGTDYRNVRVINAPTSADATFRHER